MITCIILEHDALSSESITHIIKGDFYDKFSLLGVANTLERGKKLILENSPDIVFSNAEFCDGMALTMLSKISESKFEIIIVSENQEHTLTAIRNSVLDYLVMPVNYSDISNCIKRYENKIIGTKCNNASELKNGNMGISHQEKIALPTSDGFQVILLNEIIYCQASKNYTEIFTISGEQFLITKTLKNIEEVFGSTFFFRIHKSILLNINYVKSFSKRNGFIITLENNLKFELAYRRQDEFLNIFIKKKSEQNSKMEELSFSSTALN